MDSINQETIKYNIIYDKALEEWDINRNQYALIDIIYNLSHNSYYFKPWCSTKKKDLAKYARVSRETFYVYLRKFTTGEHKLLEQDPITKDLRTTTKWDNFIGDLKFQLKHKDQSPISVEKTSLNKPQALPGTSEISDQKSPEFFFELLKDVTVNYRNFHNDSKQIKALERLRANVGDTKLETMLKQLYTINHKVKDFYRSFDLVSFERNIDHYLQFVKTSDSSAVENTDTSEVIGVTEDQFLKEDAKDLNISLQELEERKKKKEDLSIIAEAEKEEILQKYPGKWDTPEKRKELKEWRQKYDNLDLELLPTSKGEYFRKQKNSQLGGYNMVML